MKTNKIIVLGAIGVGAYLLLSGSLGGGSGERMFTLPNGQKVPESQLPSLGYVKYQEQWYHQSQLTTPNMPAGVDPNSPQWLTILNTAIQTGGQLFALGGQLGAQLAKIIKSTAVDWNNSNVTVKIVYGYMSWDGVVNPTVNVTKTYSDQVIKITSGATQSKIQLIKAGRVEKEATIDYFQEKLVGFDAGSVGITGIYIGAVDSNIDTVTNMYGIGALKGKGSRHKNAYNKMVDNYKYFVYNIDNNKIETGFEYKSDAIEASQDYDNAKVVTLNQIRKMGLADPRIFWKYVEGIGAVYEYNHPKGLTHCFDGTYSDSHKGACSYHGGAHEIKLKKGKRDYTGKGKYEHYLPYRKDYKSKWAKSNRGSVSDRIVTL